MQLSYSGMVGWGGVFEAHSDLTGSTLKVLPACTLVLPGYKYFLARPLWARRSGGRAGRNAWMFGRTWPEWDSAFVSARLGQHPTAPGAGEEVLNGCQVSIFFLE